MSYIDVETGAVVQAGHATAKTSTGWQTWAHNTETTLRESATAVMDGTVGLAVQTFLGDVNPGMQSMAKQVDALGTNTSSAGNVVTTADTDATHHLTTTGANLSAQGSNLSRPITV
ncbi:hypothetical protein [Fodinicola acaciae]|uniref:hypothetical protein n=1 Tax=Fodinicola acaciae TaxID=2681555 RepID=UPI0013D3E8B9|nr:hypothetical protein [Fodinicola acaciae]